jgi:hypothetical protein
MVRHLENKYGSEHFAGKLFVEYLCMKSMNVSVSRSTVNIKSLM